MESAYIELGLRHRRYAGDVHRQHQYYHHHHSGCRVDPNRHDGHCIVPLTSPVDTSAHAPMVNPARGEGQLAAHFTRCRTSQGHTHTHTHTREISPLLLRAGHRIGSSHWNLTFFSYFRSPFSFFRAHMRINPGWLCAHKTARPALWPPEDKNVALPSFPKLARTGAQVGTLVRHPRDLTGLRGDGKGELVAYRISLFRVDSLMMCTNRTIDRVPIHPRPL